MSVINFPTKPNAAKANAAKAKPPVAKADNPDDTITNLRIEHVTYPLWDEGKFMGQPCHATNVMFEHGGKQKCSRFHHHLSLGGAQAMVERSLKRRKG